MRVTFRFNLTFLIYAVVFGTPGLFAVSYVMAAWQQHVPWCFPPIDGCTTITETGTYAPESYLFRFGAYPLVLFQALLFYFFKHWLEESCGKTSKGMQIAWRLAFTGCVCMIGSMAVMQGPDETAEPAHTILAVAYYLLVLASQTLFTWEDFHQPKTRKKFPRVIRVGTTMLQFAVIASAPVIWLIAGITPNARYQWLIVGTFFLWHASLLFENKSALVSALKQNAPAPGGRAVGIPQEVTGTAAPHG
jgi:hypothetical protein